MDWASQTVLVTGAGGFIGSHLTERLAELGAKTRALLRYNSSASLGWLANSSHKDQIEFFFGDIRDGESMRKAMTGVDVVFHLAALIGIPYSYEAPLSYVRTNIEGTLNVLQLARELGVKRFVHTSTSEVYGTAKEFPITEAHPLQGQSPYSASKIGADQMAEAFFRSFGLPVVILRPFNTFGPRQSARAVIPTIISQALTRDRVRIGSLHPTRDLTFVADTAEGFVKAAESSEAAGQLIQLGTGRDVSVKEIAEIIFKLLGKTLPLIASDERIRPEQSEIDRLLSDNSKARTLLGWEPRHTLDEGLQATIDWMKNEIDRYHVDAYVV
jgi:dTDP-glucose 4,6-dehydratase